MVAIYEVVEVPTRSVAGDRLFTVVETVDGVCRGGDHHWVRQRYAERAAVVYRELVRPDSDLPPGVRVCHHGAPSDVVGAAYFALFGAAMFDPDEVTR